MGYLATGEIFENMLQLKRFCLYFKDKSGDIKKVVIVRRRLM